MKTTAKNLLLTLLALTAIFGIFSVPADDSAHWLTDLLISKSTGAAALWALARLRARWYVRDTTDDAPNPLRK